MARSGFLALKSRSGRVAYARPEERTSLPVGYNLTDRYEIGCSIGNSAGGRNPLGGFGRMMAFHLGPRNQTADPWLLDCRRARCYRDDPEHDRSFRARNCRWPDAFGDCRSAGASCAPVRQGRILQPCPWIAQFALGFSGTRLSTTFDTAFVHQLVTLILATGAFMIASYVAEYPEPREARADLLCSRVSHRDCCGLRRLLSIDTVGLRSFLKLRSSARCLHRPEHL